VLVPTFNQASFLTECLESIAAQTYAPVELIVVDDASTDATPDVLSRLRGTAAFRERFAGGIVIERNPSNAGAHRSINRALGLARGEYVAICNSDDRFVPERLAFLVPLLASERAMLAFSAVRMIDAGGRDITDEDWLASRLSHTQRSIGAYPSVGFALLRANVALSTGNFVFRRTLFERIGGFRDLAYCHDWDFVLRSLTIAEPVYSPRVLYEYRIHDANGFWGLETVAHDETTAVLRGYFSSIRREQFENPQAPGPRTWPGVFEAVLHATGMWSHWQRTERSPD
jgi:glycosyltransferase involved in cell wall biosynthesis